MNKKTVREVPVAGKRVLVRVDFNVPLAEGRVADDTRIRAALPTIQYLLDQGARVILMSHLGRPKGKVREDLRMRPVGERLAQLLGRPVQVLEECVGPQVEAAVAAMQEGEVVLLENLRFHPEEEANDPEFAQALARPSWATCMSTTPLGRPIAPMPAPPASPSTCRPWPASSWSGN